MLRLNGWNPRGERLVSDAPMGHWETVTFIAGLRQTGVVAPMLIMWKQKHLMLIVPLPVTSRSRPHPVSSRLRKLNAFSKINLLFSVLPRTTGLFLGVPSARLNPVS
jgi:hypothetical protein